jgi:hypothetical protein
MIDAKTLFCNAVWDIFNATASLPYELKIRYEMEIDSSITYIDICFNENVITVGVINQYFLPFPITSQDEVLLKLAGLI